MIQSNEMTPLGHYRESVTNALAGYQLLESLIKLYTGTYNDAVRAIANDELFFDFHRKDIEDAPLGRLINGLARTCRNKKLVQDLRDLKSHRDQVAHQALLCTLDNTADENYMKMTEKNHQIIDEIRRLHAAVLAETLTVGGIWKAALEKVGKDPTLEADSGR